MLFYLYKLNKYSGADLLLVAVFEWTVSFILNLVCSGADMKPTCDYSAHLWLHLLSNLV